tara:strand:+ start:650 stop:1093 length:444 start_codon:yes stop_codon:yes gene_type:complete
LEFTPPAPVVTTDEVGDGPGSVVAVTIAVGFAGQPSGVHTVASRPAVGKATESGVAGTVPMKITGRFTAETGICTAFVAIITDLIVLVIHREVEASDPIAANRVETVVRASILVFVVAVIAGLIADLARFPVLPQDPVATVSGPTVG